MRKLLSATAIIGLVGGFWTAVDRRSTAHAADEYFVSAASPLAMSAHAAVHKGELQQVIPIVAPILIGLDAPRYFPESDRYTGGGDEARAAADGRRSGFSFNGRAI